jgi:hypothetical protein
MRSLQIINYHVEKGTAGRQREAGDGGWRGGGWEKSLPPALRALARCLAFQPLAHRAQVYTRFYLCSVMAFIYVISTSNLIRLTRLKNLGLEMGGKR